MGEAELRKQFEAWISAPPFESSVARYSLDERVSAWPGMYRDTAVDLAWCAWQEAVRQQSDMEVCEHGVREGDWCADCNPEYKLARNEAY